MLVTAEALFLKVANWGYLVVDGRTASRTASRAAHPPPAAGGAPRADEDAAAEPRVRAVVDPRLPRQRRLPPDGRLHRPLRRHAQRRAGDRAHQGDPPYLLRHEKGDVEQELVPMERRSSSSRSPPSRSAATRCGRRSHPHARPPALRRPPAAAAPPPSAPQAILEQNRSLLLRGAEAEVRGPSFNNVAMQLRLQPPVLIGGVTHAEGLDGATPDKFERVVAASVGCSFWTTPPHLKSKGHRVLLFSQARDAALRPASPAASPPPLIATTACAPLLSVRDAPPRVGGLPPPPRLRLRAARRHDHRRQAAERLDRFANDSKAFVFLLGTRAGGRDQPDGGRHGDHLRLEPTTSLIPHTSVPTHLLTSPASRPHIR